MRTILKVIKVIGINLVLLFFIFGVFTTGPLIINTINDWLKPGKTKRPGVEYTKAYPWADEYLLEWGQLETEYKDYVVWTPKPFAGNYMNISKDGIRRTKQCEVIEQKDRRYLFFGSSLIFGSGSPDDLTIPSIFSEINKAETVNYGAGGHEVRQCLAYLIDLYLEHRIENKKNIIFFGNGIIEATSQYVGPKYDVSTRNQNAIKAATSTPVLSLAHLFKPGIQLMRTMRHHREKPTKRKPMPEDIKRKAAEFVVDTTIHSWLIASRLVSSHNDEFVAVIPPFYAIGHPNLEHMTRKLDQDRLDFADYVHTLLVAEITRYPEIKFIDLTDIYDIPDPIYIDKWGHYSPEGNRIFAEQLTKRLKQATARNPKSHYFSISLAETEK